MTTATKSPGAEKIGGQYDWELGADGKYKIKNVEVFSSHAFGENGVDYDANYDWIDRAFEKLVENAPKHLIPVNYSVEHRTETKRHLGFLSPTEKRDIKVNGKVRRTIFGDVVGIEPSDFEDFRATRYPFRSASIISFKQHRFRDLSMMREPGFYEYPILALEDKAAAKTEDASPLMAYHAVGEDGGDFLYAFGANDKKKSKPGDKKKDSKKSKGSGDGDKKKSFGSDNGGGGDEDSDGKDGDGDGKDEDGEFGGDGEGEDGEDMQPESMTEGMSDSEKLDQILACVKQLMMDSTPSEDEVNGNKAPSQDMGASKKNYSAKEDQVSKEIEVKKDDAAAKAAVTPASASKATTDVQDDAKYSALEDRTAKLEKKISAKENAEKIVCELEAEGYRLTASTKEKIATYAAKSDEHLKVYVDTYKAHAEKDPPTSSEGGTTGTPSGSAPAKVSGLPTDVADYAAKNPTDKAGISLRAKLFPEFELYKTQGGSITSFERFVQAEIGADASQMKLVASE